MGLLSWFFKKRKIDFSVIVYNNVKINVIIYKDVRYLRKMYTVLTGKSAPSTMKGFYDFKSCTVHSIDNSKILGHELRHVLGEIHKNGEVFKND
jgi:hypothetical protein